MFRTRLAVLATALSLVLPALANAQGAGKVPIERDLRRWDNLERRLDYYGTGSTLPLAELPVVRSDPTGVVGFSGPPGIVGDSVGSYSPLPPGAPGNEVWW